MAERKKSGAELQADAPQNAKPVVVPPEVVERWQKEGLALGRVAPHEAIRPANVVVTHLLYPEQARTRAERKVKRHVWAIAGVVRDQQNLITGVRIVCEECGKETVAGLPSDICLG